jgi:two-component system, sensor histidine kinase and response regulator
MDFSQIEAQKLTLSKVPFRLSQIISELSSVLSARAAQKGLSFSIDVPLGLPDRLVGDPARVRQVLLNLIDNAVKFTDAGSVSLSVAAKELSDFSVLLYFLVKDTGIGIPPDKCKVIFEAFSQADPSNTRRFGGTGLGLTISARLAQSMNGRLWVESQEGSGSTFHFTALLGLDPEPEQNPTPDGSSAASLSAGPASRVTAVRQ